MEQLQQILFIDIETVPLTASYDLLSEEMQQLWDKKAERLWLQTQPETSPAALFSERAGVFSEFARVVTIGIGCLISKNGQWKMVLKALSDDDEKVLLNKFCAAVSRFASGLSAFRFCGHNIREFDIPFLCRRMIIHGMQLPECLHLHGKKPWEVTHLDTLELWRFGDFKNFTSLSLLATVLGIPSPKNDLDGSKVAATYWQEHDLERINRYCLQDVYTTAKVYLRLQGFHDIEPTPEFVVEKKT